MTRTILLLLLSLLFTRSLLAASEAPLIVLVPGFFNSLSSEPDFAKAITDTITQRGLRVVTVDTLSSIGTVEENGERLEKFLSELTKRYPDQQFVLFAHSAGGLYALRALTINPSLPVQTLVSLATPWHGVEFVDQLQAGIPGLDALIGYLELNGMRQFASNRIGPIIDAIKVPSALRVISLAARQAPCTLFDCARAEKLSWVLSIAQKLMLHPSDGVVTVGSALGEDVKLKRLSGAKLDIEHWDDFVIPLDHWEIVQDAFYFRLLGVRNTEYISRTQTKVFTTILDRLKLDAKP